MTTNELQPDVEDVLQVEEPAGTEPTVKVEQQGPIRTQSLPRKAGAMFTREVNAQPVRLVGADPRRASATIFAEDTVILAFSRAGIVSWQNDPANNQAFRILGSLAPLTVSATVEIWALSGSGGAARISVMTELWATGEGTR